MAFLGGNMEVVETPAGRFVRAEGRAGLAVPLGETLPERFTIEFEATDPQASTGIAVMLVRPEPARERYGAPGAAFFAAGRSHGSGIYGADDRPLSVTDDRRLKDDTLPVRIMVDGEHAKMFVGTRRVANVPRVELGRSDSLFVFLHGYNERRPMIGDLRVAAGGRDLYEAIEAEGRVAVRDILFDTGRAEIRPASGEILADIAGMLAEHPGLSLMIEGHTDDRGEFEANMQLSSERAGAVKVWLVERHGVDPGRLRTLGLGPTRPVAGNDTEAGRQKNRRVELVRVGGAN
jgi:outer membrane protein OmpA-like peptidoglycan-associated protein